MKGTLQEVFKKPAYLAIAGVVGFFIFALSVWLRNLPLLKEIIVSSAFSLSDKILLFINFLGGITTNVTLFSAVLIIAMSVLFGINTSLIFYYIISKKNIPKKEGFGAASAFTSGLLGVGCASCGSFLLGSILASFGASGLITLLPLQGEEFSILSVVLLLFSIIWISKAIQTSKICKI